LPVEVEVATSPVPALAITPAGRIEIELSSGHRVTAEGGFDADMLARLLKGLSS
jgi:transposase